MVFDHLWLSCDAVNTVFMCKIGIKCQSGSMRLCICFFFLGNDQGVCLLEHVRLLERIR